VIPVISITLVYSSVRRCSMGGPCCGDSFDGVALSPEACYDMVGARRQGRLCEAHARNCGSEIHRACELREVHLLDTDSRIRYVDNAIREAREDLAIAEPGGKWERDLRRQLRWSKYAREALVNAIHDEAYAPAYAWDKADFERRQQQ
jgi:hypothetical protein